jgi:hypothetical protein
MHTGTMGVDDSTYLKRAIAAQVGLGANLPSDAGYPIDLADPAGRSTAPTGRGSISTRRSCRL